MAETPSPPHHGGGKGFWNVETAGLPNWAWAAVLVVGIGAVYIVPKFFGSKSTANTGTTGDTSGLGLAIDPTTGLPYAVEGLVPAGGTAGSAGGLMTTTDGGAGGLPTTTTSNAPPALTGSPGSTTPSGLIDPATLGPASDAVFITTNGKQSIYDLQAAGKDWGNGTIRMISQFNYPQLYNYPYDVPLPAGLIIQVGGRLPFFREPSVGATNPAWPGNTTQFRMVG